MGRSFTYNYILSQRINDESFSVGFHKWSERNDKIRFMLEEQLNGREATSGSFFICSQTKTVHAIVAFVQVFYFHLKPCHI